MESNTGLVINIGSLYSRFQYIQDCRKPRGKRYSLATILVCVFLAKLCGEDKPSGIAEWVKHRAQWITRLLELNRSELPNHNTYRRILANVISAEELEELTRDYFKHSGETGYQVVVSMDGKAIRGTIDPGTNRGLYLLAVYLPGEEITLAQIAIEAKENEITAAPKLLEWVDLRNKVVIGDAMHTQRQVSIQIGTARGNFLWVVKGNQPQLQQDLQEWFDTEVTLLPGMGCPPKGLPTQRFSFRDHDQQRSWQD